MDITIELFEWRKKHRIELSSESEDELIDLFYKFADSRREMVN